MLQFSTCVQVDIMRQDRALLSSPELDKPERTRVRIPAEVKFSKITELLKIQTYRSNETME